MSYILSLEPDLSARDGVLPSLRRCRQLGDVRAGGAEPVLVRLVLDGVGAPVGTDVGVAADLAVAAAAVGVGKPGFAPAAVGCPVAVV